jgi:hypothetical protein
MSRYSQKDIVKLRSGDQSVAELLESRLGRMLKSDGLSDDEIIDEIVAAFRGKVERL